MPGRLEAFEGSRSSWNLTSELRKSASHNGPSSGQHCSARSPKNPKQPGLLLRSLNEITIPRKPCMCYVLILC